MRSDHRRFLALVLSLFAMAIAGSAAHAATICAAEPRSVGALLCEYASTATLPAGVDADSVYDQASAAGLRDVVSVHAAGSGIVLPAHGFAVETAPPSGLLLGRVWSTSQDVASAR